jgi:glycosyltransferase involved in cell wall biosynthesis
MSLTISLIHPSRNRPEQASETAKHWLSNMFSVLNLADYTLSIDLDDTTINEYKTNFVEGFNIIMSNNTCVVDAANVGAKQAKGDILVLVSDDFECYPDWDIDLINHFTEYKDNVLKTNDTLQDWIVTLPIMDRTYYEACGYLYYPKYKHMFCDTDMTHKAELEGKLHKRMDMVFKHCHYTQGETLKDAVNDKADLTWMQGETTYLHRVASSFDIPNVDVMNISDVGHKSWLIQKMK